MRQFVGSDEQNDCVIGNGASGGENSLKLSGAAEPIEFRKACVHAGVPLSAEIGRIILCIFISLTVITVNMSASEPQSVDTFVNSISRHHVTESTNVSTDWLLSMAS